MAYPRYPYFSTPALDRSIKLSQTYSRSGGFSQYSHGVRLLTRALTAADTAPAVLFLPKNVFYESYRGVENGETGRVELGKLLMHVVRILQRFN